MKRYSVIKSCFVGLLAVCLLAGTAEAKQTDTTTRAKEILETTGIKGGLIVHINCGDGKLTAALRANDSYIVHGLDRDAENFEQAQKYIQSRGLYGKVSAEYWNTKHLPYVDNLVNLIVSEKPIKVPMDEVMRVLVPNGVAYIKKGRSWKKTIKPRPKEIDEWTHFLHGANNNAVAADTVVGPPHHIQWVGGPKWARSHDHLASVSAVVSTAGRIFYIADEGPVAAVALPPKWFLVARDAFNGVLLWKRAVGPWEGHLRGFRSGPSGLARRLVAVNDRVYVTLGYGKPVTALNAATGETVRRYEGSDNTLEIVCDKGLLFLVAGDPTTQDTSKRVQTLEKWLHYPQYIAKGIQRHMMVFEADTGKQLWKKADSDTAEIMPTTLAASNSRVFFQNTKEVICLDAKSGHELWRTARPVSVNRWAWSTPTLVVYGDVVLSADRDASAQVQKESENQGQLNWVVSSKGGEAPIGELIAFSAKTGKKLWSRESRECYNAPADVLVTDGLVWTGNLVRSRDPGITIACDLMTGRVKKQRPPDNESFTVGMGHHRCYRNKATNRYLLLGRAGVEFIELESGRAIPNHWVRGTCQYGIMPCNGLLYAPPHSCACYIRAKLNGFNALAAKRAPNSTKQTEARLERGPMYRSAATSEPPKESDWPTYRYDPSRSGHTKSAVPAALERSWQSHVGGRLSSPVAADGKVFVASVDTHTVHALDAKDGDLLWSYTAGGRVDSPPTIYKGLALFGSADGCVYCLRTSDGKLAWRFQARPEDRRVIAYGQLESVWPVHGNVLLQNDVAYFAAGRSSFLDGGIYLYRLDPKTGKKLSETCINSRDPKTGEEPQATVRGTDMPGALPDILSSDGEFVYMRHKRFDRNGIEQEPKVPHLYSPAGFLDDSWWHRTYWLMGTRMASGYGGWPIVGNQVPSGRLLVCDASSVYGFGRTPYGTHGSHIGLGRTHYRLFAASQKPLPAEKPGDKKKQRRSRTPIKSKVKYHWSKQIPLVVRAMVLADTTLFLAGTQDLISGDSRGLTAFEGKKGAMLYVVSAVDGEKLAEYKLDSPPVFDGMIVANQRLYISNRDGRLLCMGKKK